MLQACTRLLTQLHPPSPACTPSPTLHLKVKQYRKEVAELLRQGKQDYARIRVEGVIREGLMMQAYEILELYLELVSQRVQVGGSAT